MTKENNIFLIVFNWMVNCYDHSFFEKLMSRIFGFFSNNIPNSTIIGFFKNDFSSGKLWNKSIAAKIVRSPFSACRFYYHRHEQQIENFKENSTFFNFLKNVGEISLRDYGTVVLSLAVGMLFGIAISAKWESPIHIALTAGLFIIGCYLCLTDSSFNMLVTSSKIIRLFKKDIGISSTFGDMPMLLPHIKVIWIAAIILGFALFAFEPVGAFAGTAAAIFIILILWKTETGVFLFVPLSAILPTLALVGLVVLTFLSFLLHLAFDKKAEYVSTPFQPWIAVFLGIAFYAAVSSITIVSSVKIFMVYFVFTLAYVLIVNTIKTRPMWTALIVLFVIAATLVAVYGIFQNFFLTTTTQSWVDSDMFTDIKKRVYSTLDNPNVLGEYFIMLIPIAFAMIVKIRGSLYKVFYTICNLLMFACLMYTWSRGAWIGVVIGIAFFVLLKDRRWLAVCIAGMLLLPSVLPATIIERITSIGNMKDSSTTYRVAVWIGSLRLLKDYWFCGIGLGPDAFMEIYPPYALGGAGFALHSHNFYLQWMVDMGIVGLFVYLGIMTTGFKQIASVKEKNSLIKNVLLAMSGAFLGYLFHGIAENLWYNYRMILVFWIYFGILQSGVNIAGNQPLRKDVLK